MAVLTLDRAVQAVQGVAVTEAQLTQTVLLELLILAVVAGVLVVVTTLLG